MLNRKPVWIPLNVVLVILIVGPMLGTGCCGDVGREWEVSGLILDEGNQAIVGAEVEIFFWFSIDGPGNQGAAPVPTDEEGGFTSVLRFDASCTPAGLGMFGTEQSNTSGPPRELDVTVRIGDIETTRTFDIRDDPEIVVTFRDVPGFGIEGRIELPPMVVDGG